MPEVNLYTIDTDKGFQVAESAAWGNLQLLMVAEI